MDFERNKVQRAILDHPTRYTLICGGDGGGKSFFLAAWMLFEIHEAIGKLELGWIPVPQDKTLVFWLVGATYDKTDKEFDYLVTFLQSLYPAQQKGKKVLDPVEVQSPQVGPRRIVIRGIHSKDSKVRILLRTKSANDEQTLVAERPLAIAVCEGAQIQFTAYTRLRSRLLEHRAPMCMSGSLEHNQSWWVDLLKNWASPAVYLNQGRRSWVMKTEDNAVIYDTPEGRQELEEARRDLTEDEFNRRHMGIPAPVRGIVFPDFNTEVHVREVPWEPETPVWLAIDPGISGPAAGGSAYAILACHLPGNGKPLRVFDNIYVDNITEQVIIQSILQNPAHAHWNERPYWWGNSISIQGVIDRAGKQRAGAHEPSIEVWQKLTDLQLFYTKESIPIPDQIRRYESFLRVNAHGEPGLIMDAYCTGLMSEHGGCPNPLRPDAHDCLYRWDVAPDGTTRRDSPRDRFNDAIKALTYLMVYHYSYATAPGPKNKVLKVTRNWDGQDRRLPVGVS